MNLKWPIVVVKIAKLILMHAKRLVMRAGNIVVRHFQLESFHLKDWTGVYDVMTSKVSDFSHPRKFIKRVRSKKSTLDSGFKNRRFRCAGSQGRIVWKGLRFQKYRFFCGRGLSGAFYAFNELRGSPQKRPSFARQMQRTFIPLTIRMTENMWHASAMRMM